MINADDLLVNEPLGVLDESHLVLGEGPAWDPAASELSWIDIEDGVVLVATLAGDRLGEVHRITVPEEVGCAVPISGGRFLCGLRSQLAIVHRDGRVERSGHLIPEGRRFNDGKIDPQGRLVIGSLSRIGENHDQVLIRLEHDGAVTVLDAQVSLSNGLAWSPDGAWMYHADTHLEAVHRFSYADGVCGPRESFIDVGGRPDGITSDAEGNLWVTVFDQERVDCFSPAGDRIDSRSIPIPGFHPASVEFFGPALDRLAIATGFPRVPGFEHLRFARDGELLTLPAPTAGLPTTPWRETALPA